MKTVKYPLPVGSNVQVVAQWCRDNGVPLLLSSWSYLATFTGKESIRNAINEDVTQDNIWTAIVCDSDYELVRLRF